MNTYVLPVEVIEVPERLDIVPSAQRYNIILAR